VRSSSGRDGILIGTTFRALPRGKSAVPEQGHETTRGAPLTTQVQTDARSASMLTSPTPRGRTFGWLLRGAGVLLLGGCALGPGMEAPSINVSRIRLQDSTVLEQRFLAVLRVQNPNAVDLAIEGISYDLEVNGQPFAKGVGKGLVIIPAFSQGTIETEAITTLTGLIRQLREVGRTRRPPIAYRLTGKVKLRDHPSALPFEMRGDNLWSTRASDTPQPEPTTRGAEQPEHP